MSRRMPREIPLALLREAATGKGVSTGIGKKSG